MLSSWPDSSLSEDWTQEDKEHHTIPAKAWAVSHKLTKLMQVCPYSYGCETCLCVCTCAQVQHTQTHTLLYSFCLSFIRTCTSSYMFKLTMLHKRSVCFFHAVPDVWCLICVHWHVCICVCLGQATRGQRSRCKEAGCFLQGAGGPSGGEGKKL